MELAHRRERSPLGAIGDDLGPEPGWHPGYGVELVLSGGVDIELRGCGAAFQEGNVDLASVVDPSCHVGKVPRIGERRDLTGGGQRVGHACVGTQLVEAAMRHRSAYEDKHSRWRGRIDGFAEGCGGLSGCLVDGKPAGSPGEHNRARHRQPYPAGTEASWFVCM